MRGALTFVEVTCIAAAGVFGLLWMLNPDGKYEPGCFLLTLVATTAADMARRRRNTEDHIAAITLATASILPAIEERLLLHLKSTSADQNELRLQLKALIRDAIVSTGLLRDSEDKDPHKIPEATQAAVRSLAEAYGVDSAMVTRSEVSLAEAKPWKFEPPASESKRGHGT